MALFRVKFACILAISNPVFRWESCKGSVWRITQVCAKKKGLVGGSRLQATRMMHTCQACQKLKRRASCCTTGQKSQAGQAICSRLELATPPKHLAWENLTFHIHAHPTIYILLYSRFRESFQRKFWERNPRENKIDSSTIFA